MVCLCCRYRLENHRKEVRCDFDPRCQFVWEEIFSDRFDLAFSVKSNANPSKSNDFSIYIYIYISLSLGRTRTFLGKNGKTLKEGNKILAQEKKAKHS